MTKTTIAVAAFGMMLGACTDVPNIGQGVCGNRIVDVDEDCDGFSGMGDRTACGEPGTANACFYICGSELSGELLECPEGWGCGVDGRCRRPSGSFGLDPGISFRFLADTFAIGDVDGDGYPDIIGERGAQISIRFGAENGVFSIEHNVPVPEPSGPPAFGLFDSDKLLDVVVPIRGGLITLLGRPNRELEPVSYSSLDLANTEFGVRALAMEAFPQDQNSEILAIINSGMRFFENSSNAFLAFPEPNGSLSTLVDTLAVGDINGNGQDEFAIAFRDSSKVHICRAIIANNDERTLQPLCDPGDAVSVANPVHFFGTRFADVDGDGRLDLLTAVSGASGVAVEVARNVSGSFEPSSIGALFALRKETAFNLCESLKGETRTNPWPLAVGDFNRDGRADYVFSDAIAISRGGSNPGTPDKLAEVACSSSGRWESAIVTDINGDGWPDVAVNFERAAGIDIYINAGAGAGGELFNRFHVSTERFPLALRTGDFDGDLVQDIAYYESNFDGEPDRVAVIFGNTSGGASAPVSMGSFNRIEVFEPFLSPFEELNGRDFISDLIVVSLPPGVTPQVPPGTVNRVASILQGDSSRRMLSPMFLANGDGVAEQPRSVIFGHFFSDSGESVRDLAAIAEASESHVWLLRGIDGRGALEVPQEPSAVLPGNDGAFDYDCALWAAGNLDDPKQDSLDEVVGIDGFDGRPECRSPGQVAGPSRMVVVNVADLERSGGGALVEIPSVVLGDDYAVVRSMALRDLDGDGRLDLLAAFAGQGGEKSAAVVFWNQGGTFSPDHVTLFPAPNGEPVLEAAPIQLEGNSVPEILLLTPGRVYAARLDLESRQYSAKAEAVLELRMSDDNGRMRVADANADGLDDIVLIQGGNVQVALQVPRAPLGSSGIDDEPASQGGGGS